MGLGMDRKTGTAEKTAGQSLLLVTGPSGAGRSTAIHALEDLGYEVIDNLPLPLVPRLIDGPPHARPIALGLDARNRDFNATALIDLIDRALGVGCEALPNAEVDDLIGAIAGYQQRLGV